MWKRPHTLTIQLAMARVGVVGGGIGVCSGVCGGGSVLLFYGFLILLGFGFLIGVKDPEKSIHFYRDLLGMNLLRDSKHSDFSNYFLVCFPCSSFI